jgi:tellurite resistance protein
LRRYGLPDKFHNFPTGATLSMPVAGLADHAAIAYGRAASGATNRETDTMAEPLNHHAALIYVMVTMSAVDRIMTDAELTRIGQIVSEMPVFADFDRDNLVKTAEGCGKILSADGGLDHVLVLVRANLPPKLRETAYAVALEVAAADLEVRPEETRFLEMLRDALDLDKLTTAAIERGIRARNLVL